MNLNKQKKDKINNIILFDIGVKNNKLIDYTELNNNTKIYVLLPNNFDESNINAIYKRK